MTLTPEDLAAIEALIRNIIGTTPPSGGGSDVDADASIVYGPDEWGFIQTKASRMLMPDMYFMTQLAWGKLTSDKQRASLRVNISCDEYGNLQPAFGLGFAQADTEPPNIYTTGASPMPKKVAKSFLGNWYRTAEGFPGGTRWPSYYAMRLTTWAQITEWCRLTAEDRKARGG